MIFYDAGYGVCCAFEEFTMWSYSSRRSVRGVEDAQVTVRLLKVTGLLGFTSGVYSYFIRNIASKTWANYEF